MNSVVASDGKLATYSHRCDDCGAPWVSTHATETRCLFCGSERVATTGSGTRGVGVPRAVRTDAPKREPARPRQHQATKPEVREGRKGSRKAGREVDVTPSQRAFRDRVDRLGRG